MSNVPAGNQADEKDLFLQAFDIADPVTRERFIVEACGSDESLRGRLMALLEASDSEDDRLDPNRYTILESERRALVSDLADESNVLESLGTSIHTLAEDYELLHELGRGAVGVVYRARQISLNREVAVKIILSTALTSTPDRERFQVEAQAAANMKHPNIVPIYEIGRYKQCDFYSMALMTGGTLGDCMAKQRYEPKEAVQLISVMARAIQVAHEHGIIHRDLKPDNILLDDEGQPHISDFGLACQLEQQSALTMSGIILGTPQYMAPEQSESESGQITTAADLYSLGSVLYEMLTGSPPFQGKTILETLHMVKHDPPRSLRAHETGIDRDLDTIVLKCLEKDPSSRYDSAKAFADDLEAWLEHRPISARPPNRMERVTRWCQRRPVEAALLGMLLILLLALGIGGPLAAWRQAGLRVKADDALAQAELQRAAADLARQKAEQERQIALDAQTAAERSSRRSRSLAYSYLVRLAAAAAKANKNSLAAQGMLRTLIPATGQLDLRGWEWYYSFADVYLSPFTREGEPVEVLSFAPSGELFAISREDTGGCVLHDGMHAAMVRILPDESGAHKQMAWKHDSRQLATLSTGGVVRIWDLHTGQEIARLMAQSPILAFSWNSEAQQIITLIEGNLIQRWDVSDLSAVKLIDNTSSAIANLKKIALSPNGRFLAGIAQSQDVYLWQSNQLDQAPLVLDGHRDTVTDLRWHHDSRWLATMSDDSDDARIWEVPNGARLVRLHKERDGRASTIAWDPHGQRMLVGTDAGELVLFDAPMGTYEIIAEYEAAIVSLDWSANVHSYIVGLSNGHVALKRIDLPRSNQVLYSSDVPLSSMDWSSDGNMMVCIRRDGELLVIDAVTGEQISERFKRPLAPVHVAKWSPTGHVRIAAITDLDSSSILNMINPDEHAAQVSRRFRNQIIISADWGPKSEHFVTLARNGTITFGDPYARSHERLRFSASSRRSRYRQISIGPHGRRVLATGDHEYLSVWRIDQPKSKPVRIATDSPHAVTHAWHPQGDLIATGNSDGSVTIWHLNDRKIIRHIPTPAIRAPRVAWHPQDARLVSAGDDLALHIWDSDSGEAMLSLTGHSKSITSVAWSPDGMRLASTANDGTLRIWDATAGYLMNPPRQAERVESQAD